MLAERGYWVVATRIFTRMPKTCEVRINDTSMAIRKTSLTSSSRSTRRESVFRSVHAFPSRRSSDHINIPKRSHWVWCRKAWARASIRHDAVHRVRDIRWVDSWVARHVRATSRLRPSTIPTLDVSWAPFKGRTMSSAKKIPWSSANCEGPVCGLAWTLERDFDAHLQRAGQTRGGAVDASRYPASFEALARTSVVVLEIFVRRVAG